eukprot:TRINITY_DN74011_c0_g1_i1.p1 TRINITY_DN74011_c0_g1~~TRINITY_DN74011_c0_g1_i1.p1  ORF type:complete len:260 (-),score=56.77 TRINITY_DN74011_c0_g1_i1:23-802(-)
MSGDEVIDDMEIMHEGQEVDNPSGFNNEKMTKDALELQKTLDQLRRKIDLLRAQKVGNQPNYGGKDNFMRKEVGPDDLHRLTNERTQTFLNFNSMQSALRALQANKVLTSALGLGEENIVQLLPEEKAYVEELLEEQKELSERLLKSHDEGLSQDVKIIEARTDLAELLFRYQELRNEVGPLLLREEDKDKEMQLLEKALRSEDLRVNQMRMIIQKLMIGEDNFGMNHEDEETNARYKQMFLKCGMKPDELRKLKVSEN